MYIVVVRVTFFVDWAPYCDFSAHLNAGDDHATAALLFFDLNIPVTECKVDKIQFYKLKKNNYKDIFINYKKYISFMYNLTHLYLTCI